MRHSIRCGVLAGGVLLAAAACAPKPVAPAGPAPAAMASQADALDQRFVAAFNKADVDALMDTYWRSPELVTFGPGGMGAKGWDETKTAQAAMFKAFAGGKLELTEHHNDVRDGMVLGWGRWRVTLPAAKGPPQVLEGRYSDVKALRDGKWVYLMDHASAPLPPPKS